MDKREAIILAVLNKHTLGYIYVENPQTFHVLHASVLKGATTTESHIIDDNDLLTLASENDFDDFRVSFEGYKNSTLEEYLYNTTNNEVRFTVKNDTILITVGDNVTETYPNPELLFGAGSNYLYKTHQMYYDRGFLNEYKKPQPIAVPVRDSKKDPKLGRNEPCTCGSGKKYKHCCGK